jgi:hypothetical protein
MKRLLFTLCGCYLLVCGSISTASAATINIDTFYTTTLEVFWDTADLPLVVSGLPPGEVVGGTRAITGSGSGFMTYEAPFGGRALIEGGVSDATTLAYGSLTPLNLNLEGADAIRMAFVSCTQPTMSFTLGLTSGVGGSPVTAIDTFLWQNPPGDWSGGTFLMSLIGPAFSSVDFSDIDLISLTISTAPGESAYRAEISEPIQAVGVGIPDGGSSLALLGLALTGFAMLKRWLS